MDSFPLLKLPLLVQKVIIRQIDIIALIEVSIVSKKFKKVLQQVKLTVEKFEYNFNFASYQLTIHTSQCGIFKPTLFSFSEAIDHWKIDGSVVNIIEKNGKRITISFKANTIHGADKPIFEILEKVTKHLLSFLKVKKFQLAIQRNLDLLNLFIFKYTKGFDEMFFTLYSNGHVFLTTKELGLKFENHTIDNLYLRASVENSSVYNYHSQNQKPSKIRNAHIFDSNWVNYDNLLSLARESITYNISTTELSEKANKILKAWMSGTNETCENLILDNERHNKIVKKQIFEGTNATSSVFTTAEIEKRTNDFSGLFAHLYTIRDIRRIKDKSQATVIIYTYLIKMFVWNEKHLKAIGRM